MKKLNLKLAGTLTLSLLSYSTFAQLNWNKGGNDATPGAFPPNIGTDATWNAPLNFVTNGVQRGFISTGGFFGAGATQGDGLRIMDPSGGSGHLDLWTSASQQTHINWNGSGLIQGISSRFENPLLPPPVKK